jgi:dihydroorotate dehydrogenase
MKFMENTRGVADGIVLVNSIIRRIHNRDGSPTFGPERETAGVVGWAVHKQCLDHTRMILAAQQATGSSQIILSAGGILSEEASASYLDAGSDAVLLGSAPVFDPYLAIKIKKRRTSKSP